MRNFRSLLCVLALFTSLGSAARAQQPPDAVPVGPFKTVHLLIVTPRQEATLLAAVNDINIVFLDQGCPTCFYHLFKAVVSKDGRYTYLMTSDWPSRDVYVKIHSSAAFDAANRRNPIMSDLAATEFYGRYVEAN